MPSWPAICGCSSMFILTSLTLPPAALTAFSRTGVSCLQGPHQGAQKSTSTGWLHAIPAMHVLAEGRGGGVLDEIAVGGGRDCSAEHVLMPLDSGAGRSDSRPQDGRSAPASSQFSPRRLRQAQDQRLVPGARRNVTRSVPRIAGRHGVDQRMEVHPLVRHQACVEHHRHPAVAIVHDREGVTEPGSTPSSSRSSSAEPKESAAGGADRLVQRASGRCGVVLGDDEEEAALLVLHEQVLGVPAGDLAALTACDSRR